MNLRKLVPLFAITGVLMPLAARALPPPIPPPCVPLAASLSVDALGARVASNDSDAARRCALQDLVARGAPAARVAIGLLDSSDAQTRIFAAQTLAGLGPLASGAVPALIRLIGTTPVEKPGGEDQVYFDTLAKIGPAAKSAIPLIMRRSLSDRYGNSATYALGALGQYDRQTVAPHLARMLTDDLCQTPVLMALDAMGKSAKAALPKIKAYYRRLMQRGEHACAIAAMETIASVDDAANSVPFLVGLLEQRQMATAAVSALGVLGPDATGAVPALVAKIKRSRADPRMPDNIVSALRSMAPVSLKAQEQLLIEATQYRSGRAAMFLAEVKPLPARFAPPLRSALAAAPAGTGHFLGVALANATSAK